MDSLKALLCVSPPPLIGSYIHRDSSVKFNSPTILFYNQVLGKKSRSLASLVLVYCGVVLDKTYQTADWRLRPLPTDYVVYACEDVRYLLYLCGVLRYKTLCERFKGQTHNLWITKCTHNYIMYAREEVRYLCCTCMVCSGVVHTVLRCGTHCVLRCGTHFAQVWYTLCSGVVQMAYANPVSLLLLLPLSLFRNYPVHT